MTKAEVYADIWERLSLSWARGELRRRKAIAAGSGTAETNEDSAQCEASQSGGAKTPHRPEQSA